MKKDIQKTFMFCIISLFSSIHHRLFVTFVFTLSGDNPPHHLSFQVNQRANQRSYGQVGYRFYHPWPTLKERANANHMNHN